MTRAVLALLAVVAVAGCATATAPTVTTVSTAGSTDNTGNTEVLPTTPPSTVATTTTAAPVAKVIYADLTGTGTASLAQFTISDASWQLGWSYNCADYGRSGSFAVNIKGHGPAAGTTDTGPSELGM
jgi:ABC-type Fe3+-hydroxamate transport system substrate-binding protein